MACGTRYNLTQLQALLRQVGFPENQIAKMSAIGIYESGGCTDIINPGIAGYNPEYSVGLFQINTLAHKEYSVAQLQNPIINAQMALKLWKARTNYGDWYLSNQKYNNDYQGIASQARSVYNGNGVQNTAQVSIPDYQYDAATNTLYAGNLATVTVNADDSNNDSNKGIYYALAGFFLLYALS